MKLFEQLHHHFVSTLLKAICLVCMLTATSHASADQYTIDSTHTFVEWRVQHLGYSWLYGRFNTIKGNFYWDEKNPQNSKIDIEIDMLSLDSNHAERDKHLRSKKYLNIDANPVATFKSTAYEGDSNGGTLSGMLTLNGVSQEITFKVERVGEGSDPWGGYRVGFIGYYTLDKKDFGYTYELGPSSEKIELELGIEGIRKNKHVKR